MMVNYLDQVINLNCVVGFFKSCLRGSDNCIRFVSEMNDDMLYEFSTTESRDEAFDFILHCWKVQAVFCDLDSLIKVHNLQRVDHDVL